MTGTVTGLFTHTNQSRSYLSHLVVVLNTTRMPCLKQLLSSVTPG